MELEEIVKKVTMKQLREEAKKHGVATRCRTKLDIAKDLPPEVLKELAGE